MLFKNQELKNNFYQKEIINNKNIKLISPPPPPPPPQAQIPTPSQIHKKPTTPIKIAPHQLSLTPTASTSPVPGTVFRFNKVKNSNNSSKKISEKVVVNNNNNSTNYRFDQEEGEIFDS